MKFSVDSADAGGIREHDALLREAIGTCTEVPGPVSAAAVSREHETMLEDGRKRAVDLPPLTDRGLDAFLRDWAAARQKIL